MARGGKAEAARLIAVRERLGLSQRDFASELRVAPAALALWETHKRTIPGPVVKLIELYEEELGLAPPAPSRPSGLPTGWVPRDARALPATVLWHALRSTFTSDSATGRFVRRVATKNYVRTLGQLRGLMMKMAQMNAYMSFTLSEDDAALLRNIEQTSPAMPTELVVRVVTEELGAAPRQLFRRWSRNPVAVASLGQVHRAELADGADVAVKVQHPDMAQALRADLKKVGLLDKMAVAMFPSQVPGVYHQTLAEHLAAELDYRGEAENQQFFARIFTGHPVIRIPEVVPELSRSRVLTTRYVDAKSLWDFRSAPVLARQRAALAIWEFYWGAILRHGLYNTDPHPGNYRFGDDTVTFLDFGRVQRLSPKHVENWRQMLRCHAERDRPGVRRMLEAMGSITDPAGFDEHFMMRFLAAFHAPWLSAQPFRIDAAYLQACWRLQWRDNLNRRATHWTRDMVFLDQLSYGVGSLLAHLDVAVDYRSVMLPLIYAPGEAVPKGYESYELGL